MRAAWRPRLLTETTRLSVLIDREFRSTLMLGALRKGATQRPSSAGR
jgi:hypothetical protein